MRVICSTPEAVLSVEDRANRTAPCAGQLRALKWIGLAIVAVCGILMLGSKAEEYYYNAFFRTKLALFALLITHAVVFRQSVYGNLAALDRAPRMPGRAKLAGAISHVIKLNEI